MRIEVPLLAVIVASIGACPVGAATVVVKQGDTLSNIAQRELGSGNRWPELCELNKQTLGDCDILPVGAFIVLSPDPQPVASEGSVPEGEQGRGADQSTTEVPVPEEAKALSDADGQRVNLVDEPDPTNSYWEGYFLKPAISGGQQDPRGGAAAVRLESADADGSPGSSYSGLLHAELVSPGQYTIGVWLRSVEGEQPFRFGVSDSYMVPGLVTVGEEWRHVQAVIEVESDTDRMFQVFEYTKNNPPWEIYGVSVERGEFDTPFFPAP